jgi:hypothetical protein
MGATQVNGSEPVAHLRIDLVTLFLRDLLPLRHGTPPNHHHNPLRLIVGNPCLFRNKSLARLQKARPHIVFHAKKLRLLRHFHNKMYFFDYHVLNATPLRKLHVASSMRKLPTSMRKPHEKAV